MTLWFPSLFVSFPLPDFLNKWYILTVSIYNHQLTTSQETFETLWFLRKLPLPLHPQTPVLSILPLIITFNIWPLLEAVRNCLRKGMKARKQLCVLGTHPNLVPEVTGTMKKIKKTCREEKQTLTKSELEKKFLP